MQVHQSLGDITIEITLAPAGVLILSPPLGAFTTLQQILKLI